MISAKLSTNPPSFIKFGDGRCKSLEEAGGITQNISLAQEIIAVNIFVHSCRTGIVRTICLSLSLSFASSFAFSLSVFFSSSLAFSLSGCTLRRIGRTVLKAMKQSFSLHSFCLSFLYLMNRRRH